MPWTPSLFTSRGIPLVAVDDTMPGFRVGYNAQSTALDTALDDLETDIHDADSVATVAALPVTGNWVGRVIFCEEDDLMRVWDGTGWRLVPVVFPPQIERFETGKIGDGVTFATLEVPAVAVATKLRLAVFGSGGFDTANRAVSCTFSSSAGTLVEAVNQPVLAIDGYWATIAAAAELDLPADTATTVNVGSNSDGDAFYRGMVEILRWYE